MNFDLPALDPTQAPAFKDAAACKSWAAALPLDNPVAAHTELLKQVRLLSGYPLATDLRLALLDILWEPVRTVRDLYAPRFAGKPVPLDHGAQSAFDAVDALWQVLAQCALRAVADSPENKATLAVAIQRALEILLQRQYDCARARRFLAPAHWSLLHRLLALAEQGGVATAPLSDPVRYGTTPVTPLASYAAAMLLQAASPYGLRLTQLIWTERWARRWGARLNLLTAPPADLKAVPLCVDLASGQPAACRPASGPGARFLDTAELRKSILSRLTLLDQNTPPEELQLGPDCTQPECGAQLKKLYQAWCQGSILRRPEGKPGQPGGKLIAGVGPIFDELSGGMSLAPPAALTSTDIRKQREAMAIFGSTRGIKMSAPVKAPSQHIEPDWTVFDESAAGLRLERPLARAGARLGVGQLVALQPPGGKHFLLASVCSLQTGQEDKLQVDVTLLPGPASAIAIKAAGLNAAKEPMQPGFLLPASPPAKEAASVLLPAGRFRAGRSVEFEDGVGSYQIRLTRLMAHGEDYDRVEFEQTAR